MAQDKGLGGCRALEPGRKPPGNGRANETKALARLRKPAQLAVTTSYESSSIATTETVLAATFAEFWRPWRNALAWEASNDRARLSGGRGGRGKRLGWMLGRWLPDAAEAIQLHDLYRSRRRPRCVLSATLPRW